ncbi:MAG: CotH kinase family protein [Bacteroidales bacterium]|nr:CotH kinase family protein [Bacteroidales bacterium]
MMKKFSIMLITVVLMTTAFFSQSCTKENRDNFSIRLSCPKTMYYAEDHVGHIRVRTTPDNLLAQKNAVLSLQAQSGVENPYLVVSDKHDLGEGLWELDIKIKSGAPESTSFMVRVDRGAKNVMTALVEAKLANPGISAVTIEGRPAKFNAATSTFTAVVPARSEFSDLKLEFVAEAEKVMADGKEVTSGSSKVDFNKVVTLQAVVGNSTAEYKVEVRNTGLPTVFIETPKPITSKTTWVEGGSIKIVLPDGTVDLEGGTSVRGRGNSTWNYVKKPYAIKLDEKAKVLGMPKHKRWVLLANWKDRTLMRNDAAFWLSRHSGLDYTVKGEFVEVVLNGKHVGNYYLCEQIKIDKNRVNIEKMEPMETDPELISGGYLLEIDTYYDEVNKFKSPKFRLPYMFKEPDEEELSPAAFSYLQGYVSELEAILKDNDRLQAHEYEEYLDVDSCIDYLIVEELTNNTDFYNTWPSPGTHSCYMHKDRGGKLMHGPVWDFDYHGFVPTYSNMWAGATKTLYYPALTKDPKFRERLLERWNMQKDELRKLPDYIQKVADQIRDSEEINHDMWPIDTNFENGDESMSFDQAVARIKDGFVKKWEWMDRNIANLK